MNLYSATVPQFKRILQNVERWLDKTIAFAEGKKFDPNTLLSARLAPDQFALVRQIQSVCDQCKLTAARLAAKDPPKPPRQRAVVRRAAQAPAHGHRLPRQLQAGRLRGRGRAPDQPAVFPRR